MADFNEKDLNTMRQDALRRMREMQRRAMPRPPEGGPSPKPREGSTFPLLGALAGGERGSRTFNIGGMAIDEEKAMIAMLIYILYKQGADIKLLLALGYLLM